MGHPAKQTMVPSRRFGAYSVVSKLGEGGMSVVWLGEAVSDENEVMRVALKFAKPASLPGVDPEQLFAVEADVMGLLRHPNLVELYEVGKWNETWFLAMEYCQGGDLGALATALNKTGRAFPSSVALELGIQVLRALAYVHQAEGVRGTSLNLVHGDINPQNIFLDTEKGVAKLGDFGVVTSSMVSALPEGFTAGKVHYLSPEQALGKPLGPPSDVFAVGVVLYELLLGAKPFDGDNADQVVEKILAGKPRLPKDASGELVQILLKALNRDVRKRYQTAGQLAADLLRYQLDSGLQVEPGALRELAADALEIAV